MQFTRITAEKSGSFGAAVAAGVASGYMFNIAALAIALWMTADTAFAESRGRPGEAARRVSNAISMAPT